MSTNSGFFPRYEPPFGKKVLEALAVAGIVAAAAGILWLLFQAGAGGRPW